MCLLECRSTCIPAFFHVLSLTLASLYYTQNTCYERKIEGLRAFSIDASVIPNFWPRSRSMFSSCHHFLPVFFTETTTCEIVLFLKVYCLLWLVWTFGYNITTVIRRNLLSIFRNKRPFNNEEKCAEEVSLNHLDTTALYSAKINTPTSV